MIKSIAFLLIIATFAAAQDMTHFIGQSIELDAIRVDITEYLSKKYCGMTYEELI